MTHQKHPYRCIVLGTGLILGTLLALHLFLPYAVNMQGVRDRLMTYVSSAISGEIEFGNIHPVLLPIPHVAVHKVRISVPGKVHIRLPQSIIYPKLWPLLSGTVKLDHLKLIEPDVLLLRPLSMAGHRKSLDQPPGSIIQDYLSDTLTQIAVGLGPFYAKIVAGSVRVGRVDRSHVVSSDVFSRLRIENRHLRIEIRGNSHLARRFELEGDLDLDTLNTQGRVMLTGFDCEGFKPFGLASVGDQFPSTVMELNITFRSEGLGIIHIRFGAQTPEVKLINGTRRLTVENFAIDGHADWHPEQMAVTISRLQTAYPGIQLYGRLEWAKTPSPGTLPIQIDFNGADVNVSQIRDALMQLYGDHPAVRKVLSIVRGGTIPWLAGGVAAVDWSDRKMMDHFHVSCDLVNGHIVVPNDLFDLENVNGRILIAKGKLSAQHVSARFGNTSAEKGALELGLYDRSRMFSLDTLVDADVAQLPAVMRKLITDKDHLALLDQMPPVTGRAKGRLMLGDRIDRITAQIIATSHMKTADSAFDLMGTIENLPSADTSVRLFTRGRMGYTALEWLWQAAKASPEFILKAPLSISGADITWRSSESVDMTGRLERGNGLSATAALIAQKDDFHIKRLHVKGGGSDALISFRRQNDGQLLKAGFVGYLTKSGVDQLFGDNRLLAGWLKGRFQARIDLAEADRTSLDGQLSGKQFFIPMKGSRPVYVREAYIQGVNGGFAIPSMSLKWDEQTIRLSGKGVFLNDALDLEMTLNANALDAEKFIPLFNVAEPAENDPLYPKTKMRIRVEAEVKINQLDYGRYRIAPFRAAIKHDKNQSQVKISEADLCGIQIPGRITHMPDGSINVILQPKVAQSELKVAGSCLLDAQHTERLEGIVDLNGKITTQGRSNDELISNLKGNVDLHIEKGRIYNVGSAGLFTNLLSFLSINQYLSGDLPDLSQNDFIYNRIDSRVSFRDGLLIIKEGMVKSNSVNMAADGQYDLTSKELDLKMLVSPLTTVDWIVERIPIVGNILGGTLVAIPVRVKGHQSDPRVTPLAISAVGSRLGGILQRAVKTPVRIIEPLLRNNSEEKQ